MTFGSGPRFFGVKPAISPRSACSRHFIRCDEYRPSRRSNAPSSPRCVQAAASRRIRRFSSAVNFRLFAFGVTSVAGLPAGKDTTLIVGHASLALRGCVTNLGGGDCLRHVGTEGGSTDHLVLRMAWNDRPVANDQHGQRSGWLELERAPLLRCRFEYAVL